jgi:hypothetical protein
VCVRTYADAAAQDNLVKHHGTSLQQLLLPGLLDSDDAQLAAACAACASHHNV